MYDLIIVGAGPAGLTAGIYAARAGLKVKIFEKETIGGQISSSPLVQNYPGFVSISGAELSNNLYDQVDNLGVEIELEEVIKIEDGKIKKVITENDEFETKSIIISTGAKYKLLNLPNEKELIGNGIHFCTSCDGAFYKDKNVAVIGGANTAVTNAIYLSKICRKVYLIYRKDKLKCEKTLKNNLEKINNIEVLYNTNVTKINGSTTLESIELNNKETLNIDGMFISIGMDAQTNLANKLLNLTDDNYIKTEDCVTNIEGIFVAGDCREKNVRQLATAINDGAIAATNVINYLKTLD